MKRVVFSERGAARGGIGYGIDGDAGYLSAGVERVAEVVFVRMLLLGLGVVLILEHGVGEGAVVGGGGSGGGGRGAGGSDGCLFLLLLLLFTGIRLVDVSLHGYC